MSFNSSFSPGKWGQRSYRSDGVGGAASMVNVARALQNIRRNSPDYQSIYDDDIINRANLRNTVRDINSSLISQKILGKADVAGGELIVDAHKSGMDKVASAQRGAAWKQLAGKGIGLLLGGIV